MDNLKTPDYENRHLPKGTKNPRVDIRWMFLGFDPRPGQSWLLLLNPDRLDSLDSPDISLDKALTVLAG